MDVAKQQSVLNQKITSEDVATTSDAGIIEKLDEIIAKIPKVVYVKMPEIEKTETVKTEKPATTLSEEAQTDLEEASDLEVIDAETMDIFTRCLYAEMGAGSDKAKRLVADIVLNMVDDKDYPDNIKDVICYHGRFSVYPYAMNKIPKYEDMNSYQKKAWKSCQKAIQHELKERTSYKVMYMRTGHYHAMGKPYCYDSGAYFSTK